jgi:hypothetical protein
MRANQIFCSLSGGGGSRGVTSRSADIFTLNFIQALHEVEYRGLCGKGHKERDHKETKDY